MKMGRTRAIEFKIKTSKNGSTSYSVGLVNKPFRLSTLFSVEDQRVLSWNKQRIRIGDKRILTIMRHLVHESSPHKEDYYDRLEQRSKQDTIVFEYLKRRLCR